VAAVDRRAGSVLIAAAAATTHRANSSRSKNNWLAYLLLARTAFEMTACFKCQPVE